MTASADNTATSAHDGDSESLKSPAQDSPARDSPAQDSENACSNLSALGGQQPWRKYRYPALALGITIMVAASMTSGLLGWQLWQQRLIDNAGRQAEEAAVAYAETLTSIDSDRVDANTAQVLEGATGGFKDMYTQSSVQLRQLLIDSRATAHGTVVDSAVQSKSADQVVVLLMVDQTVSNTALPAPRVDRSRMKMTMDLVNGRWLASDVQLP